MEGFLMKKGGKRFVKENSGCRFASSWWGAGSWSALKWCVSSTLDKSLTLLFVGASFVKYSSSPWFDLASTLRRGTRKEQGAY
jgi:hypothetical protein